MTGNGPQLTLEQAQSRLLALARPLAIERCDVPGAIGRYLAEPMVARCARPAADMSAMDGYAVCAGDTAGPWMLVGESAAGRPFAGGLFAGQAVRISTGALIPQDAGAVIVQEDIARRGERIVLTGSAPAPEGRHIRRRGLDFHAGAVLLEAGSRIGPAQAALAVAAAHRHLSVRARPSLAVLDTGDELCAPDTPGGAHQIAASNGLMLGAMAAGLPCTVRRIGPVPDDLDRLTAALASAPEADVIVTSGGASVGEHDLVRPALAACGATLAFWRVAIRPGKPLLVATRDTGRGRQLIVGLPGNPASSYVTAHLFLLPLLRALLGAAAPLPATVRATLATPLPAGGARREFVRAVWDGATIAAQPLQDSGALAALAHSNALIDRPARASAAARGDAVTAYLLENGGAG